MIPKKTPNEEIKRPRAVEFYLALQDDFQFTLITEETITIPTIKWVAELIRASRIGCRNLAIQEWLKILYLQSTVLLNDERKYIIYIFLNF